MLKKRVTYYDFNDPPQKVTEEFYFHLKEDKLLELEMSYSEGLQGHWERLMRENDRAGLYWGFRKLILASYGVRSEDGRRHLQTEKLTEDFTSTNAFSALLMEICQDAEHAAAFFNGIM